MPAQLSVLTHRLVAALIGLLVVAGMVVVAAPGQARADSAPLEPSEATPTTVTADGLPTAQHNGVAWSQVVVGDTVYVAGRFTRARPAGSAPGQNEVVRNNLLAYNITTGQLTGWAPSLNAQAMVLEASPDGSRIYVGGDFTSVNGVTRNRIAAFSTSTGALITTFAPSVSSQVRGIAASDTTVWFGGNFGAVGGIGRNRLAAVSASNGALLPWAPQPGDGPTDGNWHPSGNNDAVSHDVMDMVLAGGKVVVAGRFYTLNGADATGVGALDPVSGATLPFEIGTIITNQGVNAAIFSLSTDGTNVYGTGYDFYGPGNLEGSFAVTAEAGSVIAINDCHGDHYSAFALAGVLYTAGHPHTCGSIGGFPEENPRINKFATALTITSQGGVVRDGFGSRETRGLPAPTLLPWFPTMSPGSFTGQWQAGWHVTGNDRYVVFAGEFPRVNGVGQQGMVRYAFSDNAPNRIGPDVNDGLIPNAVSLSAGTARVSWQSTFDQDNENLTYRVIRSDRPNDPVYEVTAPSTFWQRPTLGFVDRGLTPGASYTYRVYAVDPFGNQATRGSASVTVSAATDGGGIYADTVLADTPSHYWRLDEAAGTGTGFDQAGFDDLALSSGVTQGAGGALAGSPNTASSFDGTSSGLGATGTPVTGPNVFTVEAWFNTTTTNGGKIVGFGNRDSGNSTSYDRHVYMTNNGQLRFGVYPGFEATVGNSTRYNDGQWHHVVATLGPAGMALYVDGRLTGQRGDVTTAQSYNGYWRVGGDRSWSGGQWFNGRIDEVAVYDTALTAAQAQRHYVVGSTGEAFNDPPTAAYTATADGLAASFDGTGSTDPGGSIAGYAWDFGDGETGTGPTATHTYAEPGTYRVELTVTDDRGAEASTSRAISVVATGRAGGPYSAAVAADGAQHYWRLGEPAGTAYDLIGDRDMTVASGVTRGTAGAIVGDADAAATFDGTQQGSASTEGTAPGPNVFSVEAWFNTTSTSGGKIVGYGNQPAGSDSTNYDRHVFMEETGRLVFGVWTGQASVVTSEPGLNDGQWHHVVATLSPSGLAMYVDGRLTQARSDVTAGQPYDGYWRIGGDTSWAGAPYFAGAIDDVAVYPAALSAETVAAHYTLGSSEPPPNPAPVADFTATASGLTVDVDGSTSTDDGSIASYAWTFEGGDTATGPTASHTFPDSGTYDVTLTVTDDLGATNSVTKEVSVTAPPPNQAPTAAFTATPNGLDVDVDAATSADGDGTIASYAWDFGDSGTGEGVTAAHTYAAAGTYTVTLTVADDDGATATATQEVTVEEPAGPTSLAADTFQRTVSGGWGTADVGGPWTAVAGATRQSVAPGTGTFTLMPGTLVSTYLNEVSASDLEQLTTVTLGAAPTGGGVNVLLSGRRVAVNQEYRLRMRFQANGAVYLGFTRLAGSSADALIGSETLLPGGYTPGTPLRIRLSVTGTGTTQLAARIWAASAPEPAAWTIERSDSTASLQAPGGIGVIGYLSVSATTSPVPVQVTGLEAVDPTDAPPPPPPGNVAPTASFTHSSTALDLAVDGSGSTDGDGTIASYAWDFGDGVTGTGATATHTYGADGTYRVRLTVTDDDGATGTVERDVTVAAAAANVAPTASFTSSAAGLDLTVNGSGSTDPDGTVQAYAWEFGDGATAAGATASHTYAADGTYRVRLTVTDDDGATNTSERDVTVSATAAPVVAVDTFQRTVSGGWGSADTGGAWTPGFGAARQSVAPGAGTFTLAAGTQVGAYLNEVRETGVELLTTVTVADAPSGGGLNVLLSGRRIASDQDYRLRMRFFANGAVYVGFTRLAGSTADTLIGAETLLPGGYAPGTPLRIRLSVTGTGTTQLAARIWAASAAEPTTWTIERTDTTASLQVPGGLGAVAYLSSSATTVPVRVHVTEWDARRIG